MRARLVRCAASADVAGDVAAGGAVRCMPGAAGARPSADAAGGAAAGGAVYAGRGWCATGSGRLKQWTVKEAMTRGALPHDGGGRRFAFGGRFECSCVAAFAPAAEVASPRPPLAAWVRVCSGSAARKRFEWDTRNAARRTQRRIPPGCALRTSRQEVRRARGPGRSIVAVGAGRALRSFRSPPAGRFGPSAQVPTGHALPSGALRAVFRIPGSFSKSKIWRRNPARARDRLPASSGRPASLTCAADSAALRQQGYLTPAAAG